MTNEMISECMKILAGVGTVACTLLAIRKIVADLISPLCYRMDSFDEKMDTLDEKLNENTRQDQAEKYERSVHFRVQKVILMKLQGENLNGDFKKAIEMLDDCLLDKFQ